MPLDNLACPTKLSPLTQPSSVLRSLRNTTAWFTSRSLTGQRASSSAEMTLLLAAVMLPTCNRLNSSWMAIMSRFDRLITSSPSSLLTLELQLLCQAVCARSVWSSLLTITGTLERPLSWDTTPSLISLTHKSKWLLFKLPTSRISLLLHNRAGFSVPRGGSSFSLVSASVSSLQSLSSCSWGFS